MKKLLLSFLIAITFLFSFAPYVSTVKAQTSWYSQDPFEWYLKVYDTSNPSEIFGERYTAAQVQWIIYSFIFTPIRIITSVTGGEEAMLCIIKGVGTGIADVNTCTKAAMETVKNTLKPVLRVIFPEDPTLNASINNKSFIARVFDTEGRDISGIKYTKDLVNKLSLVSEVKAQGVGYSGLTWIQDYWKGFRNIAYTLLVLVVIVFAFMIMFRVKLSPQTVISVQSALPKVIGAMILITFSYAIAGFAVDLMYVVSGLFALLINVAGFSSSSVANIFGSISGTGAGYNLPIVGGLWVLFEMVAYAVMFIIAGFYALMGMLIQGVNVFGILLGVVFMLIGLWAVVLAIWYTFKVPFVLIKTLISIYLSIITAPLQILAGALVPSMGFGTWFKKLMADILVFPVVGLLFWFAWATLMSAYSLVGVDIGHFFDPNLVGAWTPGIIGASVGDGGMSGMIFLAISFGMIVLIPKVPDMLKGLLLGEKFSFGMAMGEATGALKTGWGMTGGPSFDALRRYRSAQTTAGIATKLKGMTDSGKRFEKAPEWLKEFLKAAGNKPESPYK